MTEPTTDTHPKRVSRPVAFAHITLVIVIAAIPAFFYKSERTINKQQYDPAIDYTVKQEIETLKPETILLGNSILGTGVVEETFERITGTDIHKIVPGGSASAVWYLIIKHQIVPANHTPKNLVLVFRRNYLTRPDYRTTGKFLRYMDQFAGPDERLLQRLAYDNNITAAEEFFMDYYPLYLDRATVKADIANGARHRVAGLLTGMTAEDLDANLNAAFADDRKNKEMLGEAQQQAEARETELKDPFDTALENSFLPEIIRMLKSKGINIIFVRSKERYIAEGDVEPPHFVEYQKRLRAYLDAEGIPYIDYTNREEIHKGLYDVADHFKWTEGAEVFTQYLAEDVKQLLVRD